ncbi:hypothetical protein KJ766_04230 [Patescibacteria group bacterium]|nr:hypothetical protein [Patescibacteria group bacterium]
MILLHRITSYVLLLVTILGYAGLVFQPFATDFSMQGQQAMIMIVIMLVVCGLLIARLLKWEVKTLSFWIFWGVPMFLLFSSLFLFLFLEDTSVKIVLSLVTIFAVWLYTENLFTFYHMPSRYQAYSLEYLSVVLFLLSSFLFASGTYSTQLFLQLPVWIPAFIIFWMSLFAIVGVFWVSKVDSQTSLLYALVGAVLMTEVYIAIGFLPTTFIVNAAVYTTMLYLYLGLVRVHVLEKLSSIVLVRYIAAAASFIAVVFLTAHWT